MDSDSYWDFSTSAAAHAPSSVASLGSDAPQYELAASFGPRNLSCARVVPDPFASGILTVGVGEGGGWRADLWALEEGGPEGGGPGIEPRAAMGAGLSSASFGARRVTSFDGSSSADPALRQILGQGSDLGYLVQADVAVGTSPLRENGLDGPELLLCTLSSTGYLTTNGIPEAAAEEASASLYGAYPPSPRRQVTSHRLIRPDSLGSSASLAGEQQVRFFRQGSEPELRRGLERSMEESPVLGPVGGFDAEVSRSTSFFPFEGDEMAVDPSGTIARGVEGALIQLEIDEPSSLQVMTDDGGIVGVGGGPGGTSKSPGGAIDADATNVADQPGTTAAGPKSIDPFKAMNVPCPRLCGASFGRGGGGMIVFQNGQVRKSWSWFQPDKDGSDLPAVANKQGASSAIASRAEARKQYPRTMLDLMRMNSAAKIAQWGEDGVDDDGGSVKGRDGSDDESDDADDSSHSSSDSEEFQSFFLQQAAATGQQETPKHSRSSSDGQPKDRNALPSSLLSLPPVLRNPLVSRAAAVGARKKTGSDPTEAFINPSTDQIAPVVSFTKEHDHVVLNGQCPELADCMEFGPWFVPSDFCNDRSRLRAEDKLSQRLLESKTYMSAEALVDTASDSEDNIYGPLRTPHKSFPNVEYLNVNSDFPPPPLTKDRHEKMTRSGSTGSSMMAVGLKNLFYAQSPDVAEAVPPDQTLLPKAKARSKDALNEMADETQHEDVGLSILVERESLSLLEHDRLRQTIELCLHNSIGCADHGQPGKSDTWSMLAQIVDHLSKCVNDKYDGWGGPGGGALGRDLVANIIRFYESQGDVQMLATITCVLSGGSNRRRKIRPYREDLTESGADSLSFSGLRNLLPKDNKILDAYINRYSDLLYAWGKLTTRAEVNKHLAHVPPSQGCEIIDEGVSPGIAFAPLCPRCQKPGNPETNVCESCQHTAFRCSVCTNAVRGLFALCFKCGHGGHVEHLLPWFEKETTCPTGCGCSCIITTYTSEKLVAVGSDKALQVEDYSPRRNQGVLIQAK